MTQYPPLWDGRRDGGSAAGQEEGWRSTGRQR